VGEYLEIKNAPDGAQRILFESVAANTLPLTSSCNVHCVFCSHRNNPPGVKAYRIPPRSLEDVKKDLCALDPAKPIIIGESATKIIEGEPFTHPALAEILQMLRLHFPRTPVQITTNGSLLDEKKVKMLKKLGNVVVYLSMNSAGVKGRMALMADQQGLQAIQSAVLLQRYGVPFHGSVVALPHLVGWKDLAETVKYLSACGAETVRVFLPGFSSLAAPGLKFKPSLWKEIKMFIKSLRGEVRAPVTCEPPLLERLEPEVAGVIAASPAELAGVRTGDIIETVNGSRVHTRVQAFRQITRNGSPLLELRREGQPLTVQVQKEPGQRSGMVLEYDLDPALIDDLGRALRRHRVEGALVLTSELAGPLLDLALRQFWKEGRLLELVVVKNLFFAGNICVAGLLTVSDFEAAVAAFLERKSRQKPPLVLLPGVAFDSRGMDITGRSYLELEERFGLPCEVL
jgi:NifB/MoaA-like Fe-S oxidoreductase